MNILNEANVVIYYKNGVLKIVKNRYGSKRNISVDIARNYMEMYEKVVITNEWQEE